MFKDIKESRITLTQLMLPSHSNFSGKIHAGFILGLMDQIAFACASKHSRNYCVTASVNKVDFLNLIRSQVTLLNYEVQYWKAFTDTKKANARLVAAIGTGEYK